jgi:molybdopterin-containing oxidoreductase family membrane subunit
VISPSVVDIFTFFGTFGVFSVLFLLFIRFLPVMPMAELKAVTPQADVHGGHDGATTAAPHPTSGFGDPITSEDKH